MLRTVVSLHLLFIDSVYFSLDRLRILRQRTTINSVVTILSLLLFQTKGYNSFFVSFYPITTTVILTSPVISRFGDDLFPSLVPRKWADPTRFRKRRPCIKRLHYSYNVKMLARGGCLQNSAERTISNEHSKTLNKAKPAVPDVKITQ